MNSVAVGSKRRRLPFLDASGALDACFDASEFLPVTGDGLIGGRQQRPQLGLGQQVALDLQDQPLELCVICLGHGQKLSVWSMGASELPGTALTDPAAAQQF